MEMGLAFPTSRAYLPVCPLVLLFRCQPLRFPTRLMFCDQPAGLARCLEMLMLQEKHRSGGVASWGSGPSSEASGGLSPFRWQW